MLELVRSCQGPVRGWFRAVIVLGCLGWASASPLRAQSTTIADPLEPRDAVVSQPSAIELRSTIESRAAEPIAETGAPGAHEREAQFARLRSDAEWFERLGRVMREVVRLANPSVVHIESRYSVTAPSRRSEATVQEAGSGVIVQVNGRCYVITNRHVVQDASLRQIHLRLRDETSLTPVSILSDPSTDVAVIAVQEEGLIPAQLGDSNQVDIGDFVLALGSPFGLSHSVTFGIISATGRRDLQLGSDEVRLQDFLQTDAAINPGNSGGPLLNLRGEVIGINTAIASSSGGSEGIGFAIPMNMVMVVARQLVENGEVTRAYLGVRLSMGDELEQPREVGARRQRGALVKSITPGSPADRARLQVNDLITRFGEVEVENGVHLVNLVGLTPVGEQVELTVRRGDQSLRVQVEVGDRRKFESD